MIRFDSVFRTQAKDTAQENQKNQVRKPFNKSSYVFLFRRLFRFSFDGTQP